MATNDAIIKHALRILHGRMQIRDCIKEPEMAKQYCTMKLTDYPYEVFSCLFLDNRHRVIAFEEMFRGTIDAAAVPTREVLRAVIKHNAAAVIFAHNHPSGCTEPSAADRALTMRLKEVLDLIDVRVLDSLVVGYGTATSLAQRGWI